MKIKTKILFFLALSFLALFAHEDQKTLTIHDYNPYKVEALQATADYFNSLFWTQYAPIKWKMRYLNWDVDRETNLCKSRFEALENLSLDEIKQPFNRLFASVCDGHTKIEYCDNRAVCLPLQATFFEGKVYIVDSKIDEIEPGDELKLIDGYEPLEYASYNMHGCSQKEMPIARPQFDYARAFIRIGAYDPLPEDQEEPVLLTLCRDGEDFEVFVNWQDVNIETKQESDLQEQDQEDLFFFEEIIDEQRVSDPAHQDRQDKNSQDEKRSFNLDPKNMPFKIKELRRNLLEDFFRERTYNRAKHYDKIFKSLARSEESEDSCSQARFYLRMINDVTLGVLIVPNFTSLSSIKLLDESMGMLCEQTDALVIDTRGNLGGYDLLCWGLLSRLSSKPLTNLTTSYLIDAKRVEEAKRDITCKNWILENTQNDQDLAELTNLAYGNFIHDGQLCGYPFTREYVKNCLLHSISIVEEWERGYTCTRFVPDQGQALLTTHTKTYDKPLFVLIDERSASNGDAFAAILKDNQRATLIGKTTAGLGGNVFNYTLSNFCGIKDFSLTQSLVLRNNRLVIENLGVAPDIEYERTLKTAMDRNLELEQMLNFISLKLKRENFDQKSEESEESAFENTLSQR